MAKMEAWGFCLWYPFSQAWELVLAVMAHAGTHPLWTASSLPFSPEIVPVKLLAQV